MQTHRAAALGIGLFTLALAAPAARAQSLLVGGPALGTNCMPFACGPLFDNVTGYQQIFSSALFNAPIIINQIDFFSSSLGSFSGGTFALSFGYSNLAVGGLSTNLASNASSAFTLFLSTTLSGTRPAVVSFAGTPFLYDPTKGNLLLNVAVSNWTASPLGTGLDNGTATGVCGRAYNSAVLGAPENISEGKCLVTQLDYTAVVTAAPEPSSILLIATGLAGTIGASVRARRRKRAPAAV